MGLTSEGNVLPSRHGSVQPEVAPFFGLCGLFSLSLAAGFCPCQESQDRSSPSPFPLSTPVNPTQTSALGGWGTGALFIGCYGSAASRIPIYLGDLGDQNTVIVVVVP